MPSSSALLDLRVLGPLEVVADGTPLVVDTRKALAILALLAVEGRPFARDELAAMLWPESDDEAARGALRRTLSVLRTALDGRWLRVDRAKVDLPAAARRLDLDDVEQAAATGDLVRLRTAASLARGPFLAGFSLRDSPDFDDWRATRATAVDRLVGTVLDRMADAARESGDLAAASEAARRRTMLDPLDEDAHRRLMRLLAEEGDRAAAIRQYRALVGILERELGVAPLEETTALYDAIRDGTLAPATAPPPAGPARAMGGGATGAPPPILPLLGRDAALGRLHAAHAAAAPDGRVVVVEGEAGVGKSRLVDELAARVAREGGHVIAARAHPAESGLALASIAALIRAGLDLPGVATRLAALPAVAVAEVDLLVPLPVPSPRVDPGSRYRESPAARLRFVDALSATLPALVAGPVPGLIRVDDIQWADESTLEVLHYLALRLEGRPVLLVVSWRPEDLEGARDEFADRFRELPGATVERLDRLAVDDVRALAGVAGLGTDAADKLASESEGLPLYVVEALAAVAQGGPPPRGMRALLRERLVRVSETAGQLLAAASVVGRSFDVATIRAVAGRSEDETLDGLDELVRRGLLRELTGADGWDFSHGRLREAAYEATSLGRRRLLHRRMADALRSRPGREADLERLFLIAHHERAAGRDAEAAAAYHEAGLHARRLFAHAEAIEALEAAAALGHPDGAGIQLTLGEVRTIRGDYAGAVLALEGAAGLASDDRLPGIELRLGQVHARRGDVTSAASHLEAALAGLGDPAGSALARQCLVERSLVELRAGDLSAAAALAERALRAAEAAGDEAVIGMALRTSGLIARERGDLDAARRALALSLDLASADPDPGAAIAAENALALVEAASGDRLGAIARLIRARDAAARAGERHLEAAIENNVADQLHAVGRDDESMEHLKRAVALFAEIGGRPGEFEPEIWKLVAW